MEKEEGEMSDDNSMLLDNEEESNTQMDTSVDNCTKVTVVYKSEPEKAGIVIQTLEKTDAKKLEERAKRFGLDLTGRRAITQNQIDDLYDNFQMKNGNERHYRFDTLHLNGVDGLSTKDIFEYLEDYKPVSLEWINKTSCNVVCQDHISAALAILVHSREIRDENIKKMVLESTRSHWREGFPHPKKDLILFRFATNSDKKDAKIKPENTIAPTIIYSHQKESEDANEKNPWGDLCKSWGIYDHQEVFHRKLPPEAEEDVQEVNKIVQIKNKKLAKRLGKRQQKSDISDDSQSDSEWIRKSKVPRMRMHADDEEVKERKKKSSLQVIHKDSKHDEFAPLSIEIVNNDCSPHDRVKTITKLSDKFKRNVKNSSNHHKESIQSRLGTKIIQSDDNISSDYSSDGSPDYISKSRVHKICSTIARKNSNVWSRLDNTKDQKSQNDLREKLKTRKRKDEGDLRTRICKGDNRKGRSPLRIEIDNDYYGGSE